MVNKTFLVTGSQGFIGSHLINELLPQNKIIGLNITSDKKTKNYFPLKKNILKLTSNELSGTLHGIIHLAAITDVDFCNKNPHKCFLTNVLGTQNALEIARKKDCKFVYVSTSHVYGSPKKLPINENHPKNPNSIYSSSKLAGEICCEGYSKSYGMDVAVIRLFSVYGPRSPPHLVTTRIVSQLNKKSIKLGNLNSKRDFIYIDDVIRAIKKILNSSHDFQAYNVGSGKSYSILDVCNTLKKISNFDPPIKSIKSRFRKTDVAEIKADISKAKKLGWSPRINLIEGLIKYYNWYRVQR